METLFQDLAILTEQTLLQLIIDELGDVHQISTEAHTPLNSILEKNPLPLSAFIPSPISQRINEFLETYRGISSQAKQELEWDGRRFSIELLPLSIPTNRKYFVLNFRLISNSDKQILEAKNKYQILFESSKTGILIVDWEHKKALEANHRMAELFHTSIETIISGSMLEFSPDFQPNGKKSDEAFKDILYRATDYQEFGWQFRRPDGSCFDAEVSIAPIELQGVMCGVYIIRDITERKRQEEELKKYIESNLQLENFAYIASHDLREPLLTAIGFCKQFKRMYEPSLDRRGNMMVDNIISRTENMNNLIEKLFVFSRVQTEEVECSWISTSDMLESVLEALGGAYASKKVPIRVECLPDSVWGNRDQLSRLFQNLVSNGIKFSKDQDHPQIKIKGENIGAFWKFSVEDNGIGISSTHFEKIFLLFQRLHTRKQYEGTGIGLAICKQIVENHGGRIWVDSEPGVGSHFHFTLRIPNA